jgi:hypothetical protein
MASPLRIPKLALFRAPKLFLGQIARLGAVVLLVLGVLRQERQLHLLPILVVRDHPREQERLASPALGNGALPERPVGEAEVICRLLHVQLLRRGAPVARSAPRRELPILKVVVQHPRPRDGANSHSNKSGANSHSQFQKQLTSTLYQNRAGEEEEEEEESASGSSNSKRQKLQPRSLQGISWIGVDSRFVFFGINRRNLQLQKGDSRFAKEPPTCVKRQSRDTEASKAVKARCDLCAGNFCGNNPALDKLSED